MQCPIRVQTRYGLILWSHQGAFFSSASQPIESTVDLFHELNYLGSPSTFDTAAIVVRKNENAGYGLNGFDLLRYEFTIGYNYSSN